MIEIPEAKILVRVISARLTYAGVQYLHGTKLEVTPRVFEKMRQRGAAEAVEVAIAGSANIDMEAARAKVAQEQEAGGYPSPSPHRSRRYRRG